jgi:hypothetical protein
MLTPSPWMSPPSTTTSPKLLPMRSAEPRIAFREGHDGVSLIELVRDPLKVVRGYHDATISPVSTNALLTASVCCQEISLID